MKGIALLVLVLCLTGVAVSQHNPPLLEGLWEDTVCDLIPTSPSWYQIRTIYYGPWDNVLQAGAWQSTTTVYNSSICDPDTKIYDLIFHGSYAITGEKSDSVQDFWHVNYRYNKKYMHVYTHTFQQWLGKQATCGIGSVFIGKTIDITSDSCYALHLKSIQQCPVLYDIIRREDTRIWLGSKYYGEPNYWHYQCQAEDRPTEYDHYGLGLLDGEAYIDLVVGDDDDGARSPNTLSAHLNIVTLQVSTVASANSIIYSVTLLICAIAMLL